MDTENQGIHPEKKKKRTTQGAGKAALVSSADCGQSVTAVTRHLAIPRIPHTPPLCSAFQKSGKREDKRRKGMKKKRKEPGDLAMSRVYTA